jgi:DNA-binding winged helix-turn-helix (wHTH) protein
MSPSEPDHRWLYQCDDIVVDPCAHRLERDGQDRPVEPKAYAVLVTLLQQADDVVDKMALLDAAWGHRHVTPGVLSHAISQLRHALGDSALHPRYIATVHTIGYRFIGEVQRRPRLALVRQIMSAPKVPETIRTGTL